MKTAYIKIKNINLMLLSSMYDISSAFTNLERISFREKCYFIKIRKIYPIKMKNVKILKNRIVVF